VFYIASIIFFIGGILYAFLGSGELQSWASEASNYNIINKNEMHEELGIKEK
jgi:hypothetical protein